MAAGIVMVVFLLIYILTSILIGASQTWELLAGLTSPVTQPYPLLAWIVSVAGYILVPAIIGLSVSAAAQIEVQRRLAPYDQRIAELRNALGIDPGLPDPSASPGSPPTPPATGPTQ